MIRSPARRLLGSPIGIGTARGAEDDQTDDRMHTVLLNALRRGVTVLDTAGNYRRGRSERVVGKAVRQACAEGIVRRGDVTVISKGGFLRPAGGAVEAPPPPEPHRPVDHCLAPCCLRHQLDLSLRTLCIGSLNLYLLHNPETQRGGRSQAEFDRLLLDAFSLLEQAVADGEIEAYGIATWQPTSGAEDVLQIARCKALATQAAPGNDNFRVVEAPLSLANQSALAPAHEIAGGRMSLPNLCSELGLEFIASAAAGGGSPAALAGASVRWVASIPAVTTALFGTLDCNHLDEIVEPSQRRIAPDERIS